MSLYFDDMMNRAEQDYDRWLGQGDIRGTCQDCDADVRDPGDVCDICAFARRVAIYARASEGESVAGRRDLTIAWDDRADACLQIARGVS